MSTPVSWTLRESIAPALSAAVLDWLTVRYVLPRLGIHHLSSNATVMHLIVGWLVQAVAIFIGVVLGRTINNALAIGRVAGPRF
jgi:hypothetical protein